MKGILKRKIAGVMLGTAIGVVGVGGLIYDSNVNVYYAKTIDAESSVAINVDAVEKTVKNSKKKADEKAKKIAEEAQKEAKEKAKAEEEAKAQEEAQKQAEEQAKAEAEATAQVAQQAQTQIVQTTTTDSSVNASWNGSVLTASAGVNYGPSGKETYYNLNMSGVVSIMRSMGNNDEYWVRSDGAKMLGNYVMVAANLSVHPRGSLVETSLGTGIVCDTGGFAASNSNQIDIATNW